jgi:hypothetical protein
VDAGAPLSLILRAATLNNATAFADAPLISDGARAHSPRWAAGRGTDSASSRRLFTMGSNLSTALLRKLGYEH